MKKELFKYEGRFQLWSYTVSHGQLLLRSTPSAARATQIDVLFKGVSAISLSTNLDGLEVLHDEGATLPTTAEPQGGTKLFIVRGLEEEGYVVAGAVFHIEGLGSYWDSSPLIPGLPTFPKFPPLKE
jgi:hypothetical protein